MLFQEQKNLPHLYILLCTNHSLKYLILGSSRVHKQVKDVMSSHGGKLLALKETGTLTHAAIHVRQFRRTQRTLWYEISLLEAPKVLKPMDTDIGAVAPRSSGGVNGEMESCVVCLVFTQWEGVENVALTDACLASVLGLSPGTHTYKEFSQWTEVMVVHV